MGMGGSTLAAMVSQVTHAAIPPIDAAVFNAVSDCFDHRVVGICTCGFPPVPCGFRVKHYLPVAMIETVKDQWDSIITSGAGGLTSGTRTAESADTQRGANFEAHVWDINDKLRATLTFGLSECGWCNDGDAKDHVGGAGGFNPFKCSFGSITDMLDCALDKASAAACGQDPAAIASAMQQVGGGIGNFKLPLVYASEVDNYHWHTGCRDLKNATARAPMVLPMCAADYGGFLSDGVKKAGDAVGLNVGWGDVCVGQMGPLYPRQMHSLGPTDPVAAAHTAWRALHLSHFDIGTFDKKVVQGGKFQALYPKPGGCFGIKDRPETIESTVGTSQDGRYAFVYWAPVTCCIDFEEYGCTAASG